MEKKTRFHYWNMFTIPSLEHWLSQQAANGYMFESVRNSYSFTFRKAGAQKISYHVDFRGYMPDGYMSYLTANNWMVNKLSRNWQLIYRSYRKEYEYLSTPYDEEMVQGLKRNIVITVIIAVISTVAAYIIFRQFPDNGLITVALLLFVALTFYNVLRMVFYRIMLEERIRLNERK